MSQTQKPNRVSIVLATWCPHCVPLSLEYAKKMTSELKVPLKVLDVDDKELGQEADSMVRKYGDNSEDYLVPQIFFEYSDGSVQHIMTGFSESTEITKKHWGDLLKSELFQKFKMAQPS